MTARQVDCLTKFRPNLVTFVTLRAILQLPARFFLRIGGLSSEKNRTASPEPVFFRTYRSGLRPNKCCRGAPRVSAEQNWQIYLFLSHNHGKFFEYLETNPLRVFVSKYSKNFHLALGRTA